MSLKIDFGENDFAPEETPKAAGGTELMQKWLFSRLDPELRDYFQWIASRKRKLEDKTRLFWVHDLAQDPEVEEEYETTPVAETRETVSSVASSSSEIEGDDTLSYFQRLAEN